VGANVLRCGKFQFGHEVLADPAARSDTARKVHDSDAAFRGRTAPWSRVSIKAVLEARGG
jgi:TRAP-type mannitol/chloroaromatic compound transport system substrate-binding protein